MRRYPAGSRLTTSQLGRHLQPRRCLEPASGGLLRIQRRIPSDNLIGVHIPTADVITPESFAPLRQQVIDRLPITVQSLVLIWSAPSAVGCMSVTTAFAAGYRPDFCIPRCARTPESIIQFRRMAAGRHGRLVAGDAAAERRRRARPRPHRSRHRGGWHEAPRNALSGPHDRRRVKFRAATYEKEASAHACPSADRGGARGVQQT